MIPLSWYLIFAAALFCIGLFGVLARKNAIAILMGIELMLNAVNINLVAFWRYGTPPMDCRAGVCHDRLRGSSRRSGGRPGAGHLYLSAPEHGRCRRNRSAEVVEAMNTVDDIIWLIPLPAAPGIRPDRPVHQPQ